MMGATLDHLQARMAELSRHVSGELIAMRALTDDLAKQIEFEAARAARAQGNIILSHARELLKQ